jgi:hypothetical protein
LTSLYEALSAHDRHLRFFSAYQPTRAFLTSWATIAERGGCCLIAERQVPGEPRRVVADAGYLALPGARGELAVTVAAGERGGLGRTMFDALLAAAAARGVSALEAEILCENEAMLRLVRSRGAVEIDRDERYSVRVALPTGGGAPGDGTGVSPGRDGLGLLWLRSNGWAPVGAG